MVGFGSRVLSRALRALISGALRAPTVEAVLVWAIIFTVSENISISCGQIFDILRCKKDVSGKRAKTPLENVFRSGLKPSVCR